MSEFIEYPPNRAHHLNNINCVYCGNLLMDSESNKEHVVGRRFVPKGCLDGEWNLIANACLKCNGHKSNLEDDISAITMQPDAFGKYSNDDDVLQKEAKRKGRKSLSQITGKPVIRSQSSINIDFKSPDFTMEFGFVAPPQVLPIRVYQLACYHVTGFFFMQTYNKETRAGGFPLGVFIPLIEADKADWGNDVMKWFMRETENWDTRLYAITAKEYFKISFKKNSNGLLAWAIEWNQKKRCIGFWGQEIDIKKTIKTKPILERQCINGDTKNGLFVRTEKALNPIEDNLFCNP